MSYSPSSARSRLRAFATPAVFVVALALHGWAAMLGWWNSDLPGNGFRQSQTAITALFVQREDNYTLAYPTPVLGKPWSVPFEFPLYQWAVAQVSDRTGLDLIPAGRLVSLCCFYLTLPAIWLLLGQLQLSAARRLPILSLLLCCPLFIFYARAFLIETMALMFSVWFLHAYLSGVRRQSVGWVLLANVCGAAAGLVKVTTFMVHLIPAGVITAGWLWRTLSPAEHAPLKNRIQKASTQLGWVAAACAIPFAASWWWVRFADGVKALNPSSRNLTSTAMQGYNFGHWEDRLSPATWQAYYDIVARNLMHPFLLAVVLAGLLAVARSRRHGMVAAIAVFAAAPLLFPVLYAWHDYYWVANSLMLILALGLGVDHLCHQPSGRWRGWFALVLICGGQLYTYATHLMPRQTSVTFASRFDPTLSKALRSITRPEDVLIINGEDWGSMTPFYARRRALMIRRAMDNDIPYLREAYGLLADERVAAFVVRGHPALSEPDWLMREHFPLSEEPALTYGDVRVYLHPHLLAPGLAALENGQHPDLKINPDYLPPPDDLGARIRSFADLLEVEQEALRMISPRPSHVRAQFGLSLTTDESNATVLNAHPDVRFVFALPDGKQLVSARVKIRDSAYSEKSAKTPEIDGVEIAVREQRQDDDTITLYSRLLNPSVNEEDRGWQELQLPVTLENNSRLQIEFLPRRSYERDWLLLESVTITQPANR